MDVTEALLDAAIVLIAFFLATFLAITALFVCRWMIVRSRNHSGTNTETERLVSRPETSLQKTRAA